LLAVDIPIVMGLMISSVARAIYIVYIKEEGKPGLHDAINQVPLEEKV